MPKKITVPDECIAVFTCEGPSRILRQGGSQAWGVAPDRARKCSYLVCVQNLYHSDHDPLDTSGTHRAVFMIGEISNVIPDPGNPSSGLWQICISKYASLADIPARKGWRKTFQYHTLAEMGINLAELKFHPVPEK